MERAFSYLAPNVNSSFFSFYVARFSIPPHGEITIRIAIAIILLKAILTTIGSLGQSKTHNLPCLSNWQNLTFQTP